MKISSYPVSEYEVRSILGASTTHISLLCSHANINKWSRRKPIRDPSVGELVDADFANADFGFDLRFNESGGPEIASVNPEDIFANRDWAYLKPEPLNPLHAKRIHDFYLYNSNAVSPFDFTFRWSNGSEATNKGEIVIDVGPSSDPNCEIAIEDFALFQPTCTWGILWKDTSVTNPEVIHYVDKADEEGNPAGKTAYITENATFVIPVDTSFSAKAFQACIVIFKPNDKYYLVPNSFKTISLKTVSNQEALQFFVWDSVHFTQGSKDLYASFTVRNDLAEVRNFKYKAWFRAYNGANLIEEWMVGVDAGDTRSDSVAANTQKDIHFGDGTNEDSGGTPIFRVEDLRLATSVEYILEVQITGVETSKVIRMPIGTGWAQARIII